MTHWFFWLFAFCYGAHLGIELVLDLLNLAYLRKHEGAVPKTYSGLFSQEEYQKSIAYTRAKTRFRFVKLGTQTVFIWSLVLGGAFSFIDAKLTLLLPEHVFFRAPLYPFAVGAIFYLFNLPFSIYFQFNLEERFGFNRTKPKTFVADQIRSGALALAFGWPLFALILWFLESTGENWWLYACGSVLLFNFFTAAIFPVVIAPIFYKFTPLPEGELKERLHALAKRIGFKMAGIYTIDGSRRSAHSNAFFAGMGKMRRIVLFDTLTSSMTTDEIEAVIAHEMGHNIQKHTQKQLMLSTIMTILSFYILAMALAWPPFFHAFGVATPSAHVGLVLFGLFASVFIFPVAPVFNWLSRKYEYEADQFAATTTGGTTSMSQALLKLTKDNLSNLTPHPWYSFYHYTHPTASERIAALQ